MLLVVLVLFFWIRNLVLLLWIGLLISLLRLCPLLYLFFSAFIEQILIDVVVFAVEVRRKHVEHRVQQEEEDEARRVRGRNKLIPNQLSVTLCADANDKRK